MAEPGVLTAAQLAAQNAAAEKSGVLSNPQFAEQIQMLLALKGIDSKLEEAWQHYLAGRYDDMQAAILASNFYQNNNLICNK